MSFGWIVSQQDPEWKAISASLRDGNLYVKMPRTKAETLIEALTGIGLDFRTKKIHENRLSFVFCGPIKDWQKDLEELNEAIDACMRLGVTPVLSASILVELRRNVSKGLNNDPSVDWISRTDGPVGSHLGALESLTPSAHSGSGDLEFP